MAEAQALTRHADNGLGADVEFMAQSPVTTLSAFVRKLTVKKPLGFLRAPPTRGLTGAWSAVALGLLSGGQSAVAGDDEHFGRRVGAYCERCGQVRGCLRGELSQYLSCPLISG